MIKNRTAQLVFQTVYAVLGFLAMLGTLGYFEASFNPNFYVYYTNLSNYICWGVILVSLVKTIKFNNKKEDGFCNVAPTFNFMCVIMILVTTLVYNFLLAGDKTFVTYTTDLSNMLNHLILPIMFVLNWVLFYEHSKIKWFHPLLCTIMPLTYVVLIVIRALILKGVENAFLYPYFFLNIDKLGWGGFFGWISILIVVFVALGYLLYALDNLSTIKAKIKSRKQNKDIQ